MNKYSIILPVRNGGTYVKECVNSILSQTLPNFNLVVLDNCSTDGTSEWIRSLEDHRIQYLPAEKALSIEENWNRILTIPKNEFITLIGHDDLLHPHYLQTMDALIDQYPDASLYQTHFIFIDGQGKKIRSCKPMSLQYTADQFLIGEIEQEIDSMGTGYMMRSTDFDAAGGMTLDYPKLIFADYALWLKLILLNYEAVAPTVAFSYREHDSTSRLTNGEEYQRAFGMYVRFLADLRKQHQAIAHVLDRHGSKMLLYFCQSLSHRLLKTPMNQRQTTISAYIRQCNEYARLLIPGQPFKPLLRPWILMALVLDNRPGRFIFSSIKKYTGLRLR